MADSQQQLNVETVEIEEPSDKVQVLSDEKTCLTRKHLYIIVGVLLVAAIALIGTLLGFTAASPSGSLSQQSLSLGVQATFPTFDTNNDGYVDSNEMSSWMTVQMASCKHNCNGAEGCDSTCNTACQTTNDPSTNCSTPASDEVTAMISPCDFNHDSKLTLEEILQCVIFLFEEAVEGGLATQPILSAKAAQEEGGFVSAATCDAPTTEGISGWTTHGRVPGCRRAVDMWCFAHWGCQHKDHCQRSTIPTTDQASATCCGNDPNTYNCSQCTCGSTYSTTDPTGPHLAKYCHKFAEFWCVDLDTHCNRRR